MYVFSISPPGDWHCAYVLLYGPRILEIEDKGEGDALTVATPMESWIHTYCSGCVNNIYLYNIHGLEQGCDISSA